MRRYHRWLSVLFGLFLLWISVTGVLSQVAALVANGGFERESMERGTRQMAAAGQAIMPAARAHEEEEAPAPKPALKPAPGPAALAPAPAAFVCPADMTCKPKAAPDPARAWVGYLHHLHSGEEFGPAGVVISILSGLAMVFFAFSGLWMYLRMWSHRRSNNHKPGWFWK